MPPLVEPEAAAPDRTGDLAGTSRRTTFTGNLYTGHFEHVTVLHGP